MENIFERTVWLMGENNLNKLKNSKVLVFGLGGVGGYCTEALARSGVGELSLVDCDSVSTSNINRQVIATLNTLGKNKTDCFEERISAINPNCKVIKINMFVNEDTIGKIDFKNFDYVVDAIDTITSKVLIAKACDEAGVKHISCMGTGNKMSPLALNVCDIYKTKVCPLCKVVRKLCKESGIKTLKVVYSREEACTPKCENFEHSGSGKKLKAPIGSAIFVPASAGLLIASEVVKDLTGFSGGKINLS